MKISDVMSRYVDFAAPEDTARALAELMGDLDVGALPVGSATEPLGVVTDRDILYRVVARGLDPNQVVASEILSSPIISCGADDSLQAAMDIMAAHHVRRLAVRDRDGRLEGWVTLSDLSRKLLLESQTVQAALRELTP